MEDEYYRVNKINNDLAVAHPNSERFSCTIPGRIVLAFEERETPKNPEKNLSEQRRNQQQAQPTYGVHPGN